MSALRAVVPKRILRRWDALAAQQLFEIAPRIAEELEAERRLRRDAEDVADMWQAVVQIRENGGEVGLTIDGQIVEVPHTSTKRESATDARDAETGMAPAADRSPGTSP
ncbi:MAG: hypothetical protein IRZ28_13255 [Steroidobacteraceae bacterium]|nr:hypothetical protein [Steroidobacteraceae bacterium]